MLAPGSFDEAALEYRALAPSHPSSLRCRHFGMALAEHQDVKFLFGCSVFLASAVTQADTPACGNHVVDAVETCDSGNRTNGDGCDDRRQAERRDAVCGNGIQEGDEECDDGNFVNGDSCDSTCHLERGCCCGNGKMDPGEECDDGNDIDNDGCSTSCKIDPMWRRSLWSDPLGAQDRN